MTTVVLPYDFVGGTRAIADQVDANFNALVNALAGTPTLLMAPTTFYVSPTGSDVTGNGLSPTSPAATVTWMYGVIAGTYNLHGQPVTIQLANGTYNETMTMGGPLPGQMQTIQLTIQGNMASPNLVTVIGDPCFNVTAGAFCVIQGLTVQSSVSNGLQSHYHGRIRFQNIDFSTCAAAHMLAARAGSIQSIGNYSIVGSAGMHVDAIQAGEIFIDAQPINYVGTAIGFPTVTLTGTPNFSTAFARATNVSLCQIGAVFSGTATGVRSQTNYLGSINIFGQGTTYLPGNALGTDSNGGVTG